MTMLNRLLRLRHDDDRGSAIFLIPVGALLFATASVLAVDTGLFVNDRRDAQATVDAMALAGAQELTLNAADDSSVRTNAEARAREWGIANGLDFDGDADLQWSINAVRNCYTADDGVYSGVLVTISRIPAITLMDYFSASWRSGATALACAGRPINMYGFLPFAVSETGPCFIAQPDGSYRPKIGERCALQVGNVDMSTGLNSTLGVDPDGDCPDGNPSGNQLKDEVINGVPVNCGIGQSISGGPGNTVGQIRQGIQERLGREGGCDVQSPVTAAQLNTWTAAVAAAGFTPLAPAAKGNGIDDLFEIWAPSPDTGRLTGLSPYDCNSADAGIQTSPRNANVVVVHDYRTPDGTGSKHYIVRGFVRVYIEGCQQGGTFRQNCSGGGGSFAIHARMVEQLGELRSSLGLSNYGDIGIFLKR